jgi:transposase InsO family protein
VFCHLHRRRYAESVGLSDLDKRPCYHDLQGLIVENQKDRKLKCLQSDNGGEYKSDEFVNFCRERGIRQEFKAPYSPEQNEVVERINQTI